ncbi:hypothetical protein J3R83DRAFT_1549 [Lanmaoa asiatica]|nr:hypothetical protein J3R83DRAFT_1549 [Lanmaoa asiatica]
MASPRRMILLHYFLALVACKALAAPATSSQPQMPFDSTQNATDTSLSSQPTQYNPLSTVLITSPLSLDSSSNPTDITSSQLTQSSDPPSTVPVTSPSPSSPISSSSLSPSSALFTSPPTTTILVTEVATVFETTTVDATPSSTTIVTVFVTVTATATTTPSPSWDNRTLWAAPPQMTDLSPFNITYFPSGQRNLHIVAQIPSQAIAPTAKFLQNPLNANAPPAILQLVYPAHSVNPGSKPEGGADFYASPLNLAGARNVTLEYSVFFPADFDWVKGGKLPGLFGGHTGCSGGASARDCFSTRLMWRPQGVGELYLYAPKDKQTEALCADVGSVCDATYGFSIGRGAFNFTAGDWTHLVQNVVLNTPGHSDGTFMLFVDGRPMINRTDMFYRDNVAQQTKKNKSSLKTPIDFAPAIRHVTAIKLDENEGVPQPAEFLGLFFSTFFGGHGKQYATPKQQYTWFKDFVITRHD